MIAVYNQDTVTAARKVLLTYLSEFADIFTAVKEYTLTVLPVAASSASLLVYQAAKIRIFSLIEQQNVSKFQRRESLPGSIPPKILPKKGG